MKMRSYMALAVMAGMMFGLAGAVMADVNDTSLITVVDTNTSGTTVVNTSAAEPAPMRLELTDDDLRQISAFGEDTLMVNLGPAGPADLAALGSLDAITDSWDGSSVSSLFSPLIGGMGLDWMFTGHLRDNQETYTASGHSLLEVGGPGSRLSGPGPLAPSRDERMPLIIS